MCWTRCSTGGGRMSCWEYILDVRLCPVFWSVWTEFANCPVRQYRPVWWITRFIPPTTPSVHCLLRRNGTGVGVAWHCRHRLTSSTPHRRKVAPTSPTELPIISAVVALRHVITLLFTVDAWRNLSRRCPPLVKELKLESRSLVVLLPAACRGGLW